LACRALARIAADSKPRKPEAWIQPLTDGLLERQVEAWVLRKEHDRTLWCSRAPGTGRPPAPNRPLTGGNHLPAGDHRLDGGRVRATTIVTTSS
jgi:hypothetical protein